MLAVLVRRGRRQELPGVEWERHVKKGRHRRFEEARSLKRLVEVTAEPCPECGAAGDVEHAAWCLYESEELEESELEEDPERR
jgi:hypothetical protein